jgi:HTH-type transcriptional regulator, global nitrogen regulator NrpRI
LKFIEDKHKIAILTILKDAREPIGSATIALKIQNFGYDLSSRTIRLYLQVMEEEGLVSSARRGREGGRTITLQGCEDIRGSKITNRIEYTSIKLEGLASQCTFDPFTRCGLGILNVSLIDKNHILFAIREMLPVFAVGLGMGEYVYLAFPGERIGNFYIPPEKVGIGTICSATLNGILLKSRIPTTSHFGGVMDISDGRPTRFVDVIYYDKTSLDPLEIFIKGGLTNVRNAARLKHGRIGAGFREIPSIAHQKTQTILNQLQEIGFGTGALLGRPNQKTLGVPVDEGRTALIINAGLNPIAAIEESGVATTNFAINTLFDFEKMLHYNEMLNYAYLQLDR